MNAVDGSVEGRVISAVTVTGVRKKRDTNEPVVSAAISIRHGGPLMLQVP